MSEDLHLLIVEDNPADADLLREALPETGPIRFLGECAPRLSEALTRLAAGGIDFVVTDLGLPDSQGLATFRALHQAAPDLPIIVLTVGDDEEVAVAAVREGAQDFLVKGQINGNLLVRAVRYALERKRAERKLEAEHRRLQKAFEEIRTLRGIVPICSRCKKIRDDQGYWSQVEVYVQDHTEAEFSHGVCPECERKLYPGYDQDIAEAP